MAPHNALPPNPIALDPRLELSLTDLCNACELHAERLIEMVAEGVIEPRGVAPSAWRFDGYALERARTALRLQRDLDINLAGAALVLDLLEELRTLRQRVRRLEHELDHC